MQSFKWFPHHISTGREMSTCILIDSKALVSDSLYNWYLLGAMMAAATSRVSYISLEF